MSEQSQGIWAVLRHRRQVLLVDDAEAALVRLGSGPEPAWLRAESGLVAEEPPMPGVAEAVAAIQQAGGTLDTRVPRTDLRFAHVSGTVLVIQGKTDIPYVLEPGEESVGQAVAERLSLGLAAPESVFQADVARDLWKWHAGMSVAGLAAMLVPLFEATWGAVALATALVGFQVRRPAWYLMYAMLSLGGAASVAAAKARTQPGGWIGVVVVLAFLGVWTLVRWRHFRHLWMSRDRGAGQPTRGLAAAAMWVALAGCVLSAVAGQAPRLARSLLGDSQRAEVLADQAGRLPGYVGLLAVGLGLGALSARPRRWAVGAAALGLLLFGTLLATDLERGAEKRVTPPPRVSEED
jgi:hypothetical protein